MNKKFSPGRDVKSCNLFHGDSVRFLQPERFINPAKTSGKRFFSPAYPRMGGRYYNDAFSTVNSYSPSGVNCDFNKADWQNLSSEYSRNPWLLAPAIYGSAGALVLGFVFHGHSLSGGYNKVLFFIFILALIASLGVGFYIYEVRLAGARLAEVIIPALLLTFFFGTVYNLIYSLYPATFSGTVGDTPLTQFLSFLSLSSGSISVGESVNVTAERAEVQILIAIEFLFSLFALSLIISVVA